MAGGIHGVPGHRVESMSSSAVDGVAPAGGHLVSPAACLRAAVAAGPMTPAERAELRSKIAAVKAQDEAARAPSPQGDLLERAA